MPPPPPAAPPSIPDALARLWNKFLPEIENRIALIETAARALGSGTLSEEQREAAHAAAHKLAGTLGTFGFHRGTELARHAELALEAQPPHPDANLSAWAAELRQLVDARGNSRK